MIESDRGQARIEHQSDKFRYVVVSGDPLELGRLARDLRSIKNGPKPFVRADDAKSFFIRAD